MSEIGKAIWLEAAFANRHAGARASFERPAYANNRAVHQRWAVALYVRSVMAPYLERGRS